MIMRGTHRAALMAVLMALALGVGASASASAAECPGTGSGVALCSGGHVQLGSFPFTSTWKIGTTKIFSIQGIMSLSCTNGSGHGEFVTSAGKVEIKKYASEWTGCSVPGAPSCHVAPIVFGVSGGLKGLFAIAGEAFEIKLSPSEGETKTYAEFSVTGCEQERGGKVKGTHKCQMPHSVTTEAVAHELNCAGSGSSLTFEGTPVTVTVAEELSLTSGHLYSIQRD